jgi:hypothetical protein
MTTDAAALRIAGFDETTNKEGNATPLNTQKQGLIQARGGIFGVMAE